MQTIPIFRITELGDFTVEIGDQLICFATAREVEKEFARLPDDVQVNHHVIAARGQALELARLFQIECQSGAGAGQRAYKAVFQNDPLPE